MKLLKDYFRLKKEIHDYFGYREDWVDIPLSDETDCYWFVTGEGHGGVCVWGDEPLTEEFVRDGGIYSGPIYTQRFLPKWVYRKDDYTMVCVDTQTDGNKFLMIFDNSKECKDQKVVEAYKEAW